MASRVERSRIPASGCPWTSIASLLFWDIYPIPKACPFVIKIEDSPRESIQTLPAPVKGRSVVRTSCVPCRLLPDEGNPYGFCHEAEFVTQATVRVSIDLHPQEKVQFADRTTFQDILYSA